MWSQSAGRLEHPAPQYRIGEGNAGSHDGRSEAVSSRGRMCASRSTYRSPDSLPARPGTGRFVHRWWSVVQLSGWRQLLPRDRRSLIEDQVANRRDDPHRVRMMVPALSRGPERCRQFMAAPGTPPKGKALRQPQCEGPPYQQDRPTRLSSEPGRNSHLRAHARWRAPTD
jgi:hypothetical protein